MTQQMYYLQMYYLHVDFKTMELYKPRLRSNEELHVHKFKIRRAVQELRDRPRGVRTREQV